MTSRRRILSAALAAAWFAALPSSGLA